MTSSGLRHLNEGPAAYNRKKKTFTTSYSHAKAVCALGSLTIIGVAQNVMICVKMEWGKHLAGSACGDDYSLITL